VPFPPANLINVTESASTASSFEFDLRSAIEAANLPVLLMVLVHLTGDLRWLEQPYLPSRQIAVNDNDDGSLPPEVQREIRDAAVEALTAWRIGAPIAIERPDDDLVLRMLGAAMGEEIPPEYGPMLAQDLASQSEVFTTVPAEVPAGFTAIIVGAGISGLCAATTLERLGVPYIVLEKSDQVGGVWHENRYPGCGVDTPSHLYSFSFATYEWSQFFAMRSEIHDYLQLIADRFDIRNHIRFNTEVKSAAYDAQAQVWRTEIVSSDGEVTTLESNVLVSAVGIFNPLKYPEIKGLETFGGPVFHSARWPADLDIDDKRIAVIGNGASAMQIGPAIVDQVKNLTVFQRSSHWIMPFDKFQVKVTEPVRWLFRELPFYGAWYRLRLAWIFNDKAHATLRRDPGWQESGRSLNLNNDRLREFLRRYVLEVGDRTDLLEKVLPTYPPYGKRMLLDNGWYRMLRRDNVALVSEAIVEVRPDEVVTESGATWPADIVVLATGFDVSRFLSEFEIRGRSGRRVQDQGDDVRAFLGTVMPDLPNFFCLYGPNTQPAGGSIMFTIETQTHLMASVLTQMLEKGMATAECKQDVHDEYNAAVDQENAEMVWNHPGMRTYYRNSKGRVAVNSPYRNVDWWHMTRSANLDDFILEPPRRA
jgi:4-hydroxyacetophenone monooxygenase